MSEMHLEHERLLPLLLRLVLLCSPVWTINRWTKFVAKTQQNNDVWTFKESCDCFQNTPQKRKINRNTESTTIVILNCTFNSTKLLPLSIRPTITELCGKIPEPKHSGKHCNCSDSASPSAVRPPVTPPQCYWAIDNETSL